MRAKLEQNITWNSAPDLIHEYVFFYIINIKNFEDGNSSYHMMQIRKDWAYFSIFTKFLPNIWSLPVLMIDNQTVSPKVCGGIAIHQRDDNTCMYGKLCVKSVIYSCIIILFLLDENTEADISMSKTTSNCYGKTVRNIMKHEINLKIDVMYIFCIKHITLKMFGNNPKGTGTYNNYHMWQFETYTYATFTIQKPNYRRTKYEKKTL